MVDVGGVDGAQHVELGAVLLEQARRGLDLVEDRATGAVVAVGVVQLARAVDAQAHEDVVLGEEGGPLVVEQGAVRLDGALDLPAGGQRVALDLERSAEEVEAHERGLAALPRERHERHLLRLDRLANERLHDLVGHALVAAGVERRLLEEEAVVAAQVAARPGGLGHDVECGACVSLMRPWYAKLRCRLAARVADGGDASRWPPTSIMFVAEKHDRGGRVTEQQTDAAGGREARSTPAKLARTGTRLLLLALLVGIITGAATWLFLSVDHLGVVFLWETLPERFPTLPAWAVPGRGRRHDDRDRRHSSRSRARAARSTRAPPSTSTTRRGAWSIAACCPARRSRWPRCSPARRSVPRRRSSTSTAGSARCSPRRLGLKPEQVKMMAYAGVAGALAAFLGGAPVGALLAMEFISPKAISMSRTALVAGLASGATAWATYLMLGGREARHALPVPRVHHAVAQSISRSRSRSGSLGGVVGLVYGGVFVKSRVKFQGLRAKPVLAGIAGGSVTALAAVASPYLLFSGQSQVPDRHREGRDAGAAHAARCWESRKIALSVWSLSTAYFGGPLFPLMFAGLCFGLALNLAVPGIPQGVAVMALIAGMLVAATVVSARA